MAVKKITPVLLVDAIEPLLPFWIEYGMREFAVQDPGGHFITFAQPVAAAQH